MSTEIGRLLRVVTPIALESGAEWAGVRRVRSDGQLFVAKDGKFESSETWTDDGIMVEVLFDGQFGYAATSDMSPEGTARCAIRALLHATNAAPLAIHRFDQSVRPGIVAHYKTPRRLKAPLGADVLCDFGVALTQRLKVSPKIIQAQAEIYSEDFTVEFASTSGARLEQTQHRVSAGFGAVARDGTVIQRRTGNGPRGRTMQGGREFFDFEAMLADAVIVGEQAVELLSAPDCPTMTADLVLAPDQMMLQIHESVGHPCEMDRMLGDERNFAGSTFVKLDDIGKLKYGSELMNIAFDPTIPTELASYAADDIGAIAHKRFIVKDGVLVAALGSLESQARSGKPGVANQRVQNWNRPAIDRMANLNMKPGSSTFDSIIGSIERGIYMEANRSWSIDDYRNKFQFGCEYGRLIENGTLTKTVRNPNYRGISSTFWQNLFKVGNKDTFKVFGTPNCGKGEPNQVITVGHASPVCAFRSVEIFGGEA